MKTISFLVAIIALAAITALATEQGDGPTPHIKATPAYEMLIVKRAAVTAEVVEQQKKFTSQHPDVVSSAYELSLLNKEIGKMLAAESSQLSKLSRVYGQLLLRKIELQVEERDLRNRLTLSHPDLKRKRVELNAIQHKINHLMR